MWKFDSEEALKKQWVTTADSDWGEGYSSCSLSLSPSGKTALFSGELSTRVPQDGRLVKAGYCTLNSVKQRRAFNRYKDLVQIYSTLLDISGMHPRCILS